MPLIYIEDWPKPVEAGRQRILEAALDAGVPFPHGCGSGECGSCKCRLLEGRVECDRYSPEALSAEEAAQGLILACRARPLGDVRVKWLSRSAALSIVRTMATVKTLERVAHDVIVVTLALPAGRRLGFMPGQFAKVRFGRLPARSYSFANQPGTDELVFHVREVPGGLVSQFVGRDLRNGAPVEVRGPFGDAHWDEPDARPLLLVGGGTGLAPMLSILIAALTRGQRANRIHLYHGVRASRDLYAEQELGELASLRGFRYVPVLADEDMPGVRSGPAHEAVAEDFASLVQTRVFAAGPPEMVDAVRDLALSRGAAPDAVRVDAFYAAEPEKKSLWERITSFGSL